MTGSSLGVWACATWSSRGFQGNSSAAVVGKKGPQSASADHSNALHGLFIAYSICGSLMPIGRLGTGGLLEPHFCAFSARSSIRVAIVVCKFKQPFPRRVAYVLQLHCLRPCGQATVRSPSGRSAYVTRVKMSVTGPNGLRRQASLRQPLSLSKHQGTLPGIPG